MMMRNDDEDTEKSLDCDLIGVTVGQAYLNPGFKPLKGSTLCCCHINTFALL